MQTSTHRLLLLLCLIGIPFSSWADEFHFQTVVVRNDAVINGEFHMNLQVRIASGVSPRTMGAFTCDIYYSNELAAPAADPAVWWALGATEGYRVYVSKLVGFYRVLVIDDNINSAGNATPPGQPAGWNVTNEWQTVVTLRWIIQSVSKVNILIEERTDAAAFLVNLSDAPNGLMENWDVHSFSLGEISLPIELAFFSASVVNSQVLLKWATNSESNNYGFRVYRSQETDGPYQLLSQEIIQGAANSTEHRDYAYLDAAVEANVTYYYKLADLDREGGVRFHGPVNIKTAGPTAYSLEQNYPNPFNGETRINFSMKEAGVVELQVLNLNGQLVRTLLRRTMEPGNHFAVWNGRDDQGRFMSSGIYLYQIHANEFQHVHKMHYVK